MIHIGEEAYIFKNETMITHGTSLQLMSRVAQCLQTADLHDINPTKDWKKTKKRKLQLYYVTATTAYQECASCMRLLYDDDYMIIEYLYTLEECRCQGIGRLLVEFITELAVDKTMCVISTNDACSYWMSRGFEWYESKDTDRLNPFNDTFLLTKA